MDDATILPVREPYDWGRVLDWLGTRAIPGLECADDGAYRRDGVTVTRAGGGIAVHGEADTAVVARVFDTAHDPAALGGDPLFARAPGIRVPGAWSGWELAVRAVLGQQVSVAGARRTGGEAGRGARRGGRFPTPEAVAEGELPGMPASRGTGAARARAAVAGRPAARPAARPRGHARALLALPGFGPWTVEYIAMRALRDPDAWPGSDLWLRRASAAADPERWRPWRAYAAMVLWQTAALALGEPPPALQVAVDDEVAPVGGDDLPVAAAQRLRRPPAVLDEPRLAHGLDRPAADRLRPPALPRARPRPRAGVASRLTDPMAPASAAARARASRDRRG